MAESKFQRKFYGLDSRQGSAGIRRVSASVKFSFSHFLDFKYILLHVFPQTMQLWIACQFPSHVVATK